MSDLVACPIWGTNARLLAGSRLGEGMKVFSLRAGGRYRISREAMDDHGELSPRQRALITNWLVDQRRLGEPTPFLTAEGIDAILHDRPLRFGEKKERLFRAFSGILPGRSVYFADRWDGDHDDQLHPQMLLAQIGVESFKEALAIILMLREEGLLSFESSTITFTGKGYEHLDSIEDVRWRRFSVQFGGLAKVGSGSDYAASLCSGLALSGAGPG